MSSQQGTEPVAPTVQESAGPLDGAGRNRELADFPIRLFAHDMAAIFGIGLKRVYQLDAEGAFLFAENKPRIGRKSWSRDRVRQYFAGDLTGLTVGRKRG